jgi:hypothetical protein
VPAPEGMMPLIFAFGVVFILFMVITWMVSRIAKKRREQRM